MKILYICALQLVLFGLYSTASAQHAHTSRYVGQETRTIKHLSADDMAELERGGGWGMAKAAELNGLPGPAHLLELKDKIPLSPAQVKAIEIMFKTMKADAIKEGTQLIALERQLDTKFRNQTITDAELRRLLDTISNSRRDLRYIHLSAHLATPDVLTPKQITRYNQLRGYGAGPCAKTPEGHAIAMWKRHNSCN